MGGIDDSPLPNTLYRQAGINTAAYESKPWSNSSPSGPDKPILRACFPSIPSEKKQLYDGIFVKITLMG